MHMKANPEIVVQKKIFAKYYFLFFCKIFKEFKSSTEENIKQQILLFYALAKLELLKTRTHTHICMYEQTGKLNFQ